MNNLLIVVRISDPRERVRISKIIGYFQDRGQNLILYKKKGPQDHLLNIQYVNVIKYSSSKIFEYLKWCYQVFFLILKRKENAVVWATAFDGAFPVFLASWFKKVTYIYDNADNFHQSVHLPLIFKKIVRKIDNWMIKRSVVTLIPNGVRALDYAKGCQFQILKNFPSQTDYKSALTIDAPKKKAFVIYINGWLMPVRGLKMIEEFVTFLPSELDLEIKVAGKNSNLTSILQSSYVRYLGEISSIHSLAHYRSADVVLTFYDPQLEINRIATPNKWGDCLVTNTVPIINEEVLTINDYFPFGGYVAIKYGDSKALLNAVMNLYENPSFLKKKKEELQLNPSFFWETQLDDITSKINVLC
jgi:hypothetical protein